CSSLIDPKTTGTNQYLNTSTTSQMRKRLKVWEEKDQPRVHVVPAFAPYYAPQAELHQYGDLRLASKTYPPFEQVAKISLWERLGKAAMLNIESSSFSWEMLSSLHHTEHSSSNEHPEDDTKALKVSMNSRGVVFFALFNLKESGEFLPKEAATVIKITSSRMATQSEQLGCEFAKWLGVRKKAREIAVSKANEVGEMTCSELQEALELSRSLYLMNLGNTPILVFGRKTFGLLQTSNIKGLIAENFWPVKLSRYGIYGHFREGFQFWNNSGLGSQLLNSHFLWL
ncbi:dual specificity protein phosphatase PHS1, partial [Tanacetum coccineum]